MFNLLLFQSTTLPQEPGIRLKNHVLQPVSLVSAKGSLVWAGPSFLLLRPSFIPSKPSLVWLRPSLLSSGLSFICSKPSFLLLGPSLLSLKPSFIWAAPSFLLPKPSLMPLLALPQRWPGVSSVLNRRLGGLFRGL